MKEILQSIDWNVVTDPIGAIVIVLAIGGLIYWLKNRDIEFGSFKISKHKDSPINKFSKKPDWINVRPDNPDESVGFFIPDRAAFLFGKEWNTEIDRDGYVLFEKLWREHPLDLTQTNITSTLISIIENKIKELNPNPFLYSLPVKPNNPTEFMAQYPDVEINPLLIYINNDQSIFLSYFSKNYPHLINIEVR